MSEETKSDSKESSSSNNNSSSELDATKAELAKLRQEIDSYKKKDESLLDKVVKESNQKDKEKLENKELESALTFNLTCKDFIKSNHSILPKELEAILKASEKETYGSAIHKANAIKAEFIQTFFSQESNLEMLTESQKSDLAEFQKLTKNWREAKANEIYRNLFEPALEALKRVRKAEELSRASFGYKDSKGDSQYKQKLMGLSRKHYLGEK